ncbi:MAG: tRNA lysidine(34) synthetase TilS [Cyclobacteriaceae bacterium]|nr:tRNA lysidine(34) synthetase TilS [Cyclobacteriaceae bacterium]
MRFDLDKNRIFVDADTLEFPLKIRPWRAGDWFMPLGMKHKKS